MSVGYITGRAVNGGTATVDASHLPNYEYYYDIPLPGTLIPGVLMIYGGFNVRPVDSLWIAAGGGGGAPYFYYKYATAADVTAGTARVGSDRDPGPVVAAIAFYGGATTVTVNPAHVGETAIGATIGFISAPDATVRSNAADAIAVRLFAVSGDASYEDDPAGTTPRISAFFEVLFGSDDLTIKFVDKSESPGSVGIAAAQFGGGTSGGVGYGQTFVLEGNHTPAQPIINEPGSGASISDALDNPFGWTFTDIDPGDTQSAYDFRYSDDGGSTWTTVSDTTSDLFTTVLAGTFTAGSYQAQVRVYDHLGAMSAYSPSLFFTVTPPPPAPVITDPTSGDVVSYTHTVIWTVTAQDSFEVRRVADSAGSPDPTTVYFDSGFVSSSTARSAFLTFPVNSRDEHIQVRVRYLGIPSDWDDVLVHVVWIPPGPPTVTLTASDTSAAIQIDLVASTDMGSPPAVSADLFVSADLGVTSMRIATGLDPTSTFIWWLPASDVDYTFQVIAYAADGSPSISDWIGSATHTPGDLTTSIIDGGGP